MNQAKIDMLVLDLEKLRDSVIADKAALRARILRHANDNEFMAEVAQNCRCEMENESAEKRDQINALTSLIEWLDVFNQSNDADMCLKEIWRIEDNA